MTGREGFGLAIRIAGGWKILESLTDVYYVLVKMLRLPTGSALPIQVDIDTFVFRFLIGSLLIIFADVLVKLVYGARAKPVDQTFA